MIYNLYQHRNGHTYSLFANDTPERPVVGGNNSSINQIIGLINTRVRTDESGHTLAYYTCKDSRLGNYELIRLIGVTKEKLLESNDIK